MIVALASIVLYATSDQLGRQDLPILGALHHMFRFNEMSPTLVYPLARNGGNAWELPKLGPVEHMAIFCFLRGGLSGGMPL